MCHLLYDAQGSGLVIEGIYITPSEVKGMDGCVWVEGRGWDGVGVSHLLYDAQGSGLVIEGIYITPSEVKGMDGWCGCLTCSTMRRARGLASPWKCFCT